MESLRRGLQNRVSTFSGVPYIIPSLILLAILVETEEQEHYLPDIQVTVFLVILQAVAVVL
jgi:hypothetical protein